MTDAEPNKYEHAILVAHENVRHLHERWFGQALHAERFRVIERLRERLHEVSPPSFDHPYVDALVIDVPLSDDNIRHVAHNVSTVTLRPDAPELSSVWMTCPMGQIARDLLLEWHTLGVAVKEAWKARKKTVGELGDEVQMASMNFCNCCEVTQRQAAADAIGHRFAELGVRREDRERVMGVLRSATIPLLVCGEMIVHIDAIDQISLHEDVPSRALDFLKALRAWTKARTDAAAKAVEHPGPRPMQWVPPDRKQAEDRVFKQDVGNSDETVEAGFNRWLHCFRSHVETAKRTAVKRVRNALGWGGEEAEYAATAGPDFIVDDIFRPESPTSDYQPQPEALKELSETWTRPQVVSFSNLMRVGLEHDNTANRQATIAAAKLLVAAWDYGTLLRRAKRTDVSVTLTKLGEAFAQWWQLSERDRSGAITSVGVIMSTYPFGWGKAVMKLLRWPVGLGIVSEQMGFCRKLFEHESPRAIFDLNLPAGSPFSFSRACTVAEQLVRAACAHGRELAENDKRGSRSLSLRPFVRQFAKLFGHGLTKESEAVRQIASLQDAIESWQCHSEDARRDCAYSILGTETPRIRLAAKLVLSIHPDDERALCFDSVLFASAVGPRPTGSCDGICSTEDGPVGKSVARVLNRAWKLGRLWLVGSP